MKNKSSVPPTIEFVEVAATVTDQSLHSLSPRCNPAEGKSLLLSAKENSTSNVQKLLIKHRAGGGGASSYKKPDRQYAHINEYESSAYTY